MHYYRSNFSLLLITINIFVKHLFSIFILLSQTVCKALLLSLDKTGALIKYGDWLLYLRMFKAKYFTPIRIEISIQNTYMGDKYINKIPNN